MLIVSCMFLFNWTRTVPFVKTLMMRYGLCVLDSSFIGSYSTTITLSSTLKLWLTLRELILLRFLSITCCFRLLIAIVLAINGTLMSMSLLNAIPPGEVCIVWFVAHRIACTHVANALSIISSVSRTLTGGAVCIITRRISVIVRWLRSTTPFDCGSLGGDVPKDLQDGQKLTSDNCLAVASNRAQGHGSQS